MSSFEIRHTFPITEEQFWNDTFFNEEFNRELYLGKLGFDQYEVLEQGEEAGGVRARKVRTTLKIDAPGPVRKLVGDSVSYVETGKYDPATRRYRFRIEPSKLADKLQISGEMWCEPRGDKRVERILKVEATAKIFGVGKLVEGTVEKNTRDSYDKAADFTNQWIAERGL
ncbi:MAG: DUF2505 domain-containing protein [Myxococcota bacterium]